MGKLRRWIATARTKVLSFFVSGQTAKTYWNSPWVGIPLWISAAICVAYWRNHTPAPGYAIGALGVVAGVMSVREINVMGKITWVAILVCLLITEFRAIDKDRADNEQKQKEFFEEQKTGFNKIAAGLEGVITKSQKQFDATMKRSDQAIGAIDTNIEAVTGSKSFPVYSVTNRPNATGAYPLILVVMGKYPIRGMSSDIRTIESKAQQLEMPKDPEKCFACEVDYFNRSLQTQHAIQLSEPSSIPGFAHMLGESLPLGKYQINTYSLSGFFLETLTLELDAKDQLRQTSEIEKGGHPTMIVVGDKLVEAHIVNGKIVPTHEPKKHIPPQQALPQGTTSVLP